MSGVTIVDYGSGNLLSVSRALAHCGGRVELASGAEAIDRAERLVLPGVGAFADGMEGLRQRGLIDAIRRFAASGRPLLGICLGMQMLATTSEEFGLHEGLAIVPGRVLALPRVDIDGRLQKIPCIGWSDLVRPDAADWRETVLAATNEGDAVYLVHSYHVVPDNDADRLACCVYGGHFVTTVIRRDNVTGCQFHPEKSGPVGLRILSTFLASTALQAPADAA